MEVDYKPLKNFDGVVKIKMPRYKERIEMIKEMQITPKQNGNEVEANATNSGIDSAIFMSSIMEKYILSIDVKHIQSGLVIKSLEELECYKEGVELINEIGSVLFNGISLGNA